jgi:cobalt-precorrin-5B (C1)-methyltransferase
MKKLRSGYTTGACAAAAAKAAMLVFLGRKSVKAVEIPFPDGTRVGFKLHASRLINWPRKTAMGSVIKDAGDDPDVTNGAVVEAYITISTDSQTSESITLAGGKGVGVITKPGLAVPVGESAINPVPRKMIIAAVQEAIAESELEEKERYLVTISIPKGEELALKTLNKRLGIIGGLSILGTTGIVRPISAEAWTATIKASMQVAAKNGVKQIVLSTGRTSERAIQEKYDFVEEALVMMGDYLQFSLEEAGRYSFSNIHLAGMWAKLLKAAMEVPQTHVRHGALETDQAIAFIENLPGGKEAVKMLTGANTAREIYTRLITSGHMDIVTDVCRYAKRYCQKNSSLPVTIHLVEASGRIVASI